MSTKYDKAVRALNLAELALRQACRGVENDLSVESDRAAGGASAQPSLQPLGAGPSGQGTSSSAQTSPIQRGEYSGRREPPNPRPRRRLLSTICPHCKNREREIGMEESDAVVIGFCTHGVQDDISEVPEEEDHVAYLPKLGSDGSGATGRI